MTTTRQRADVLAEIAERVALRNEFRTDTFQDDVMRMVNAAREQWREEGGELPGYGVDRLFDALRRLAEEADSSPIAMRDACAAALRAAEEATLAP